MQTLVLLEYKRQRRNNHSLSSPVYRFQYDIPKQNSQNRTTTPLEPSRRPPPPILCLLTIWRQAKQSTMTPGLSLAHHLGMLLTLDRWILRSTECLLQLVRETALLLGSLGLRVVGAALDGARGLVGRRGAGLQRYVAAVRRAAALVVAAGVLGVRGGRLVVGAATVFAKGAGDSVADVLEGGFYRVHVGCGEEDSLVTATRLL